MIIKSKSPAPIITLLGILLLSCPAFAQSFVIPKGMSEAERVRFKRFETFQIKGVCGDQDLERLAKYGVNTLRGYTIGEPTIMREKLDHAPGGCHGRALHGKAAHRCCPSWSLMAVLDQEW